MRHFIRCFCASIAGGPGLAALVLVVPTLLCPANSSAQVFTNRAAFQTALGSTTIETFESTPPIGNSGGGSVPSVALADFTVSATPQAVKILSVTDGFGAFNTTPAGSRFLYLDTDIGRVGSATTFSFNSPRKAFGFDYTGVTEAGNVFTATINGQVFTLAANPNGSTAAFWGYIPPSGSLQTALLTTTIESGYGIDQVSYAVPEPASLGLIALAAPLLARRRKAR